jgi:hypothetical protein
MPITQRPDVVDSPLSAASAHPIVAFVHQNFISAFSAAFHVYQHLSTCTARALKHFVGSTIMVVVGPRVLPVSLSLHTNIHILIAICAA